MRLQFGELPAAQEASAEAQDWHVIHSPGARPVFWLAALIGLVVLGGLCLGLGLVSLALGDADLATSEESAYTGLIMVAVLLAYIPLHELLHLLAQPGAGRTDRSVVIVWPARLRFGVYYEGSMSRQRWLLMRLAPLAGLSLLPAGLLALSQAWPLPPGPELALEMLMTVNTLGCGADIMAALVVLRQVPPAAEMVFQGGRAYWRPAASRG